MNVFDVCPCVFVVLDSVGGRVVPFPLRSCRRGRWDLQHVLSCACMWGWMCGGHSEDGIGGPCLRVGGVVRVGMLVVVVLRGEC